MHDGAKVGHPHDTLVGHVVGVGFYRASGTGPTYWAFDVNITTLTLRHHGDLNGAMFSVHSVVHACASVTDTSLTVPTAYAQIACEILPYGGHRPSDGTALIDGPQIVILLYISLNLPH